MESFVGAVGVLGAVDQAVSPGVICRVCVCVCVCVCVRREECYQINHTSIVEPQYSEVVAARSYS